MSRTDAADAARRAYDATADVFVAHIGTRVTADVEAPLDRAVLGAFVEMTDGRGVVGDLGCGVGRVAALLHDHGLDAVGVDVSTEMLAIARSAHPAVSFVAGDLSALPLATASLGGAVCWYSIIHTPADGLSDIALELRRVTTSGAPILVAFQTADDDAVTRDTIGGRAVTLTSYRHSPAVVAGAMQHAGLDLLAEVVRAPATRFEETKQAFLLFAAPSPC
jgi:ubiquinone/menaquinone biosynthesis C-methylase UbiE